MTDTAAPRQNPHFDKPIHLLRQRTREWNPAERIGMAQKMHHRAKPPRPTLVPLPPALQTKEDR